MRHNETDKMASITVWTLKLSCTEARQYSAGRLLGSWHALDLSMLLRGKRAVPNLSPTRKYNVQYNGLWLWRIWQSSRFRHQRSAVGIPTSAITSSNVIIGLLQSRKDDTKEKEAGKGPWKKSNTQKDIIKVVEQFLRHIYSKFEVCCLAYLHHVVLGKATKIFRVPS